MFIKEKMRIITLILIALLICPPSFAKRLDEMNANTSPDITNDLIYSQDVSDTSEASTGTGKSLTIKNLLKAGNITVDGTNVGINTVSPIQKLQIVGTVQATAFIGDGSGLTGVSGSGSISDTAYGVGWDGDTATGASKNALYDKIETLGSTSGGWTNGGGNISPTTSSDTVGIGTTVSTWAGSRLNVRKTTAPTDTTTFGSYTLGAAADVSYVYPNATDDVVWSLRGYAKQTGSAVNTGGGHSIGVAGLAEDTSGGKLNLAGVEGRTQATGTADRYSGVLGLVEAVNGSYTGKLYGMYSTFVGSHNGDSISFYAVPTSSGARNYSFWGSNDLVITSGNVGIGTYRPSANLELVKQSTTTPLMISSTATSDGDYLIVKSSGNVGINTINPVSSLNVVGTVNATAFVGDGSGLTGITGGGGLGNVVEDTTPQLGGDLDLNGNSIDFPSTANISDVLDEDNMASDSATKLATQQSIKAYVDTAISGVSGGAGGWTDNGTTINLTTSTDTVGIGTTSNIGSTKLQTVGPSSSNGDDFIGLFVENGVSPEASALTSSGSTGKAVGVQGDGGAYYLGRDVTNNIEFIMGTSITGVGFAGTLSAHDFQIRTANSARVTVQNSSGNVGIGTTVPVGLLNVSGGYVRIGNGGTNTNATSSGEAYVQGDLEVDGTIYGSLSGNASTVTTNANLTGDVTSSGNATTLSSTYKGWTDGGTNIYPTLTSDQVAIGTTTPVGTNALTVRGTIGGSGTGPIVLSDANVGIGTTTAPALLTVGSTGSFQIDTSGNTRVGIGTTTAGTIICVKSISSGTAVLGYCTGSLTNSICGTCN